MVHIIMLLKKNILFHLLMNNLLHIFLNLYENNILLNKNYNLFHSRHNLNKESNTKNISLMNQNRLRNIPLDKDLYTTSYKNKMNLHKYNKSL
jgi:hypothetical protein